MADYIDRQAVNDALDKTCDLVCQYSKKQRYAMCGACPLGSAYDVIENVPSADVQPVRHGKWEERKVSYKNCIDEWQTACCSVCHKYHTTPYMYYFDNYNYCPNCGARMDGEQDG